LTPAEGPTDIPTYHGYNNTASRIDYVLMHGDSCRSFGLKQSDIRIVKHICKEEFTLILSTHDALLFEIALPQPAKSTMQTEEMVQSTKIKINYLKWEEANVELNWKNLETFLELNFSLWENPENLQVLASSLPQAFIQAAELSVPTKTSKQVKKSEEWRKTEILANKAAKIWRENGKPRGLDNKFLFDKKEARSKLRGPPRTPRTYNNCID
jgi:hypothetical protein